MKRKLKTARIVVPVTPEDLRRVKVMAQAQYTDVAELVRQMVYRAVAEFEKQGQAA